MRKCFFLGILVWALFSGRIHAQTPAYRLRAWAGDSIAMLELSEAFFFGKSVEKNEDSAKFYIKKASDKGNIDAQFLLGTQYMTDVFDAAVFAKGIKLLQKAAENGHADAQYRLCEKFSTKGRGNVSDTYFDIKKAYYYGEMAAKQGLAEALMYCAEARLKASGTIKNDSIAASFFRRAAVEKNYVPAHIRLGDMYFEGKVNGKVEPFVAVEWYEKALTYRYANIDQKGKAEEGIHHVDQFFKKIQNTYLDANPAMPMGMFDYRIR